MIYFEFLIGIISLNSLKQNKTFVKKFKVGDEH